MRRAVVGVAAAGVGVLGIVGVLAGAGLAPSGAYGPAVAADVPIAGLAGDTVADLFGINEAISVPARFMASASPAEIDARLDRRIAMVRELGVRHVRVHTSSVPYLSYDQRGSGDLAGVDAFLTRLFDAGIQPDVMIGPWPGNAPGIATDHYVPTDRDAYAAWVSRVVERYDGDGKDDLSGLKGSVRTWEVDNEPDLHHSTPPRGGKAQPADFESVDDYAKVAAITADAIRAADPTAIVLPAGLWAGPRTREYGAELWSKPAFASRFAELNVHSYPTAGVDPWSAVDALLAEAPGREVWLTEVSIGDQQGEQAQAAFLADLSLAGLQRGIKRIDWHSLVEPPAAGRSPTEGHHLFTAPQPSDPPHAKLAAVVLADLIARYGTLPRERIESLPARGGFALRLGEEIVAFGPPGEVSIDLPDGDVTVVGLLPDETDGAAVLAAGGPHSTSASARATLGALRVDVTRGPVRIVGARLSGPP